MKLWDQKHERPSVSVCVCVIVDGNASKWMRRK